MIQLDDLLGRVVAILDDLEIAYHVGGSFASSYHGVPRARRATDSLATVCSVVRLGA